MKDRRSVVTSEPSVHSSACLKCTHRMLSTKRCTRNSRKDANVSTAGAASSGSLFTATSNAMRIIDSLLTSWFQKVPSLALWWIQLWTISNVTAVMIRDKREMVITQKVVKMSVLQ